MRVPQTTYMLFWKLDRILRDIIKLYCKHYRPYEAIILYAQTNWSNKVIFTFKSVFCVTGLILHNYTSIILQPMANICFTKWHSLLRSTLELFFSGYILGSSIISDYICWVEFPFHVLLSSSSSSLLWSLWMPPCSLADEPPPGTLLRTLELSRSKKTTDQHRIFQGGGSSWLLTLCFMKIYVSTKNIKNVKSRKRPKRVLCDHNKYVFWQH